MEKRGASPKQHYGRQIVHAGPSPLRMRSLQDQPIRCESLPAYPGDDDAASSDDLIDHFAVYVRQPEVAALKTIGQAGVINAEQAQHRRL